MPHSAVRSTSEPLWSKCMCTLLCSCELYDTCMCMLLTFLRTSIVLYCGNTVHRVCPSKVFVTSSACTFLLPLFQGLHEVLCSNPKLAESIVDLLISQVSWLSGPYCNIHISVSHLNVSRLQCTLIVARAQMYWYYDLVCSAHSFKGTMKQNQMSLLQWNWSHASWLLAVRYTGLSHWYVCVQCFMSNSCVHAYICTYIHEH